MGYKGGGGKLHLIIIICDENGHISPVTRREFEFDSTFVTLISIKVLMHMMHMMKLMMNCEDKSQYDD